MHFVKIHHFADNVNKIYGNKKLEMIFNMIIFELKILSAG